MSGPRKTYLVVRMDGEGGSTKDQDSFALQEAGGLGSQNVRGFEYQVGFFQSKLQKKY